MSGNDLEIDNTIGRLSESVQVTDNIKFVSELDDAFSDDGLEQSSEFTSNYIRQQLSESFSNELTHSDDLNAGVALSTVPIIQNPKRPSATTGIHSQSRQSSEHISRVSSPDKFTTRDSKESNSSTSSFEANDAKVSGTDVIKNVGGNEREANSKGLTNIVSPETPKDYMDAQFNAFPIPNSSVNSYSRQARPVGPSALEKVVSKTRPSFLPPKSREEDRRHLADWEAMMKRSRATESQRIKSIRDRRRAREEAVERSIEIWEKEIIPDWRKVVRDDRLRKLWWNGIPPKLRPQLWEWSVGNALALSRDTFRTCLARARRMLSSNSFPTSTLTLIEKDIESTLPSLRIFNPETGPLYHDLKDLLLAWVVARSDEGLGYVIGASKIAAMLLLNMPSPSAFVAMRNLLERHCMRSFYGGLASKDDVEAYYRIFDTLLADVMPKVYFNFKQHQISPASYLPDWLLSLFLEHLSLETCARIWDVLLLEGDSFLYRMALSILAALESRLFFPERTELISLLQGQNKAALELAKREGMSLEGGKFEIYGLDEDILFSRLEGMSEWWKESTWTRLIQRELPDL